MSLLAPPLLCLVWIATLALKRFDPFNGACVYYDVSALELFGCRDLTSEICGSRVRHEGLSDSFLDILFCEPSQSLNRVTVPHFDLDLAV